MEDSEHLLPSVRKELLSIPRVGDGLAFLRVAKQGHQWEKFNRRLGNPLQLDMSQVNIRNVTNKYPPDFEDSLPLVGSPDSTASGVIDLGRASVIDQLFEKNSPVSTFLPCHRNDH